MFIRSYQRVRYYYKASGEKSQENARGKERKRRSPCALILANGTIVCDTYDGWQAETIYRMKGATDEPKIVLGFVLRHSGRSHCACRCFDARICYFNRYSLFPVGYIICAILLALFFPSKLCAKWHEHLELERRIVQRQPLGSLPDADYWQRTLHDCHVGLSKIVLAFIPALLTFVIFFNNKAKTFSFMIGVAMCFPMAYYIIIYLIKETAKENKKHQQVRVEQEKREELGKWK